MAPFKTSKFSKEFASLQGLPSSNPNDWTEDQLDQFQAFKVQKDKERMHGHYEVKKKKGTATYRKKSKDQQNKDAAKHRAIVKALRNAAVKLGLQYPPCYNKGPLCQLLQTRITDREIKAIEAQALHDLEKNPHQPKAPDENGYRKPGPARNQDGEQDFKVLHKRAMGRDSTNRSYAKIKALHDKALEFEAMPPLSHFNANIGKIRDVLRKYIGEDEISEIEEEAV